MCLELKIKKIFNFAAVMHIVSMLTHHKPRNYSQGWKRFMI